MNLKIGHSTLTIEVEGCIQCGTKWSSGWAVAKLVTVKVGQREHTVSLHICADCMKTAGGQPVLL
jgi:hypothetical protein